MILKPFDITRRQFVVGTSLVASASWLPTAALAQGDGRKRLVFLILRGGQDGLSAIPPYGEPNYRPFRSSIAIPAPGGDGTAFKLDGLFAMHPKLKTLFQMYLDGQAIIVNAIAPPDPQRSHFAGQDILENGTTQRSSSDGWIGRALAARPDRVEDRIQAMGMASTALPLTLYGAPNASVWATPSFKPSEELRQRVASTFVGDPVLGPSMQFLAGMADLVAIAPANINSANPYDWPNAGNSIGQLLAHPKGPDVIVMSMDGWDTHGGQGAEKGNLADKFGLMDGLIANLKAKLGATWSQTVVVAATEFGRTVRVNGGQGTDHGSGGTAFVFGGAVRGGRILGDWPGLGQGDLHEGRDLKVTTDSRALFKGIVREHWGLADNVLDTVVFPESAAIRPMEGLIV